MDVIVPFGKYKGQPVTNLISDHKYVEWLKDQDWFSNHKIYNIVVNQNINTNQDSKTPAHNELQNLFLKEENCMKIYKALDPSADDTIQNFNNDVIEIKEYSKIPDFDKYFKIDGYDKIFCRAQFEAENNWDVKIGINSSFYIYEKNFPGRMGESKTWSERVEEENKYNCSRDEFNKEQEAFSKKHFKIDRARGIKRYFYIEIKPILSDDYPNVLRKMNQQVDFLKRKRIYDGDKVLLVKDFSSSVTSKDDLISIFEQHNINVLFVKDLYDDVKLLTNNEETIESLKERIRFLEEENATLRSNM